MTWMPAIIFHEPSQKARIYRHLTYILIENINVQSSKNAFMLIDCNGYLIEIYK